MGRPRKLDLNGLKKATGANEVKQLGNQIQMVLDPSKLSNKKRAIANGLMKSVANTMYNAPFDVNYFDGPGSFEAMNTHEQIKIAMKYFRTDPLVGKIIETMKTFANDGFKNEHPDPEIKRIFDNWCKKVDMDVVLGWIFLEYFRSGNVTTYRELMQYKEGMIDEDKEADYYWAEAAKKKDWSRKQIPIAYTVLNPLTVYAEGTNPYKDNLYENISLSTKPFSKNDMTALSITNAPGKEFKDAVRADFNDKPLADKQVSRILRMRQPYEKYGCVLMERAFSALYEKNKLRQMDMAIVNSNINQLIVVTVGNDDYPATPRQLKLLADQFQNAGKSQTIFWNHTLKIELIQPNIAALDNKKYERVNEDIRNAFGISEILVGGGGSKTNFATGYLSLKAFLTNLIEARKDVERWLKIQYKDVADALGLDSIPEPSFNPLSLTDEIAEKQMFMQLVDRGIISYQTAQSRLGFDPNAEIARRKQEQPLIKDGVLGFVGNPFQQVAAQEIIDTAEEAESEIEVQDKKKPDNSDQKASQKNRARKGASNPSVSVPKSGLDGRPKTPKGNYPEKRKTAKIKGQGSADGIEEIEVSDERGMTETEIVLAEAGKVLNK